MGQCPSTVLLRWSGDQCGQHRPSIHCQVNLAPALSSRSSTGHEGHSSSLTLLIYFRPPSLLMLGAKCIIGSSSVAALMHYDLSRIAWLLLHTYVGIIHVGCSG